ncbi:MAG: response regulator [Deltaproteobacteria bacterium]|nr:response regulator [Deltaproteobacteria bacterium]
MARILLADDEAVLIMQLKKRLETFGHQVVGTAASGEKAVELARAFKPDLMLMDIVMPGGLDGLDASEIIKGELDTPIIFMSGHADDHVLERIKNAQPDGFIVKPINEFELKVTVEIVLGKIDQSKHFKKYRNHLEGLIEKRTAELEASNAELQIEITKREQAEKALERLCSAAGSNCPKCHSAIPSGARFCPHCGDQIVKFNKCPQCGKTLPPEAKFCMMCGAKLEKPKNRCPDCGTPVLPEAGFCNNCGAKLK